MMKLSLVKPLVIFSSLILAVPALASGGGSPHHHDHDDPSDSDSDPTPKPAPQSQLEAPRVTYIGNVPRTDNNLGVIDTAALDATLRRQSADGFDYIFEHQRAPSDILINEYRDHFKDYLHTLSRYQSKVFLTGFNLVGRKPFGKDYAAWAKDIAQVSLDSKNHNLQGLILDDFFAKDDSGKSFLDPKYLGQVCKAAHDVNPRLKFYATVYCEYDDQQKDFADYLRKNPEISSCMEGVYLFVNPKTVQDKISRISDTKKNIAAGSAMIKGCMGELKKGKADLDIKLGVYIAGMSKYNLSVQQRRLNWEYARNNQPSGWVFWMTPNAGVESPDVDTKTHRYTPEYQKLIDDIGDWAHKLN